MSKEQTMMLAKFFLPWQNCKYKFLPTNNTLISFSQSDRTCFKDVGMWALFLYVSFIPERFIIFFECLKY